MASDVRFNDAKTKIMREILESSKEGLSKKDMLDNLGLSYQQLREITAELADKKFLRYSEPDGTYITTDKGFKFLEITKDAEEKVNKSMLSNETTNDHLS
jgi:predicted transcriptional regulator